MDHVRVLREAGRIVSERAGFLDPLLNRLRSENHKMRQLITDMVAAVDANDAFLESVEAHGHPMGEDMCEECRERCSDLAESYSTSLARAREFLAQD